MRKNKHIKNLSQLRQELAFLKQSYEHQEVLLKQNAQTYINRFSVLNLLKKYATPNRLIFFDEKTNLTGRIMSLILPVLINKTLFRNSGFITKTITAFGAKKLGQLFSFSVINDLFKCLISIFIPKDKKKSDKKELVFTDYGIPADSETY